MGAGRVDMYDRTVGEGGDGQDRHSDGQGLVGDKSHWRGHCADHLFSMIVYVYLYVGE